MPTHALDTMARADKGPLAPATLLDGQAGEVAQAVATWPGVIATAHWDLFDTSRIDGVDFYVGDAELGHIHLDGAIHLATSPDLGAVLIAEGSARRFRYGEGWVCEDVERIGAAAAIALFRRNHDRIRQLGTTG